MSQLVPTSFVLGTEKDHLFTHGIPPLLNQTDSSYTWPNLLDSEVTFHTSSEIPFSLKQKPTPGPLLSIGNQGQDGEESSGPMRKAGRNGGAGLGHRT